MINIKITSIPNYRGCGIYSIVNLVNGKVYVGSALSVRGRLLCHRSLLKRNEHPNTYLQRAWNKYKAVNFKFVLLDTCDESLVLVKEQQWIDGLEATDRDKGYNLALFADNGPMKGRKHSRETCQRMSERLKGIVPIEATNAAAIANKGKQRPIEVRIKIAVAQKGKPKNHGENVKKSHWSKGPNAKDIIERMKSKLKGRKLTSKHRNKISEGGYRRWRGTTS